VTVATMTVALAACWGGEKHGEAAKSPSQIAQDAAAATKSLHSFRLDGRLSDAQGPSRNG
jgi:hypothetical protein